jgi:hypothetical protein
MPRSGITRRTGGPAGTGAGVAEGAIVGVMLALRLVGVGAGSIVASAAAAAGAVGEGGGLVGDDRGVGGNRVGAGLPVGPVLKGVPEGAGVCRSMARSCWP